MATISQKESQQSKPLPEELRSFCGVNDLLSEFVPNSRELLSHHISSFNYLISTSFPKIIGARVNNTIVSEVNPLFSICYKNIRLRKPDITENFTTRKMYPNECRLRDMTYAGALEVDLEIRFDDPNLGFRQLQRNLTIAKLPVMIGSQFCWLSEKNDEKALAAVQECPYDPQGYFVIKGVEKVVLMQEQLCRNKILVDEDHKTGLLQASCASATLETKSKIAVILKNHRVYLKSSSFKELIPISVIFKAYGVESDKAIISYLDPFLNSIEAEKHFPLLESVLSLTLEPLVKHSVLTQEDALVFLSTRVKYLFKMETEKSSGQKVQEVKEILQRIILPHIYVHQQNYTHKINYIALMTRKLLRGFLGLDRKEEGQTDVRNDRDYLGNKRVECAGDMLGLLFEDLFKRFNGELRKEVDKFFLKSGKKTKIEESMDSFIRMVCSSDTITNGMVHAISSGNWTIKRFKVDRKGVTQLLSRINYIGALGMLTRLESHIEKSRKVSGPRSLQCSHFGYICPVDTPDGENCGLVKNLALLAKVTTASEDVVLLKKLYNLGMKELGLFQITEMNTNCKMWIVLINGKVSGGIENASRFIESFKDLRRKGSVDPFVSVFEDPIDRVIDIWSDAGRLVRPLINIKELGKNFEKVKQIFESFSSHLKQKKVNLKIDEVIKEPETLIKSKSRRGQKNLPSTPNNFQKPKVESYKQGQFKDSLLALGVIEYLDVNELNNCNIAFSLSQATTNSTHVEISVDTLLGVIAGTIPFPHHNQSPRNTYQCAMGKQALGVSGLNLNQRIDTVMYQLVYPQKPLVESRTSRISGYDKLPAGQNATIAVMSYSGFDIEDAVIINKASIERGLGRAILSKKVVVDFEKGILDEGDIIVATDTNPDGIVDVAQRLNKESIIVNKHVVSKTAEGKTVLPQSVRYKGGAHGTAQRVILTSSGEKYLLAKVLVSQIRTPEVGDKFSSRHGQKGVMSIKVAQTDLPFSETGWVPDIVMNPHGFPSRMTVGKLLELLAGKAACLNGDIRDGSAFQDKLPCEKHLNQSTPCECKNVVKEMGEVIQKHGFEFMGTEVLISGTTGEYIKGYIFSGPVYYQRLKHLVADKIHARSTGKKTFLTRQPLEGRAKEGGLRLGEMERDCLVAYGATEILVERFLYASDVYYCPVCQNCKMISCNGSCVSPKALISRVRMPYPFKLLIQELFSMNIVARINLK
jgi:DNA-directed RNA polymerase III subunit RPC2